MDPRTAKRANSRRGFLVGATALGLATLAGCAERKPFSAVGSPFPEFRLKDIDGNEHDRTQYAGLPLIANFWATWCPPCRAEMPDLDRVHRRSEKQGLRVIGFSIDQEPHAIREFRLRVNVGFPLVLDVDQRLSRQIGITSYPTTLLVASSGLITEVLIGPRPWPDYPGVIALEQGARQGHRG